MTYKNQVEWVPLDLPTPDSAKEPTPQLVTWEKVDLSPAIGRTELASSVKERLKLFPQSFQKEAAKAWEIVGRLETDTDAACKDPEVKNFVRQLAASGHVGSVYIHEQSPAFWPDAPRAVECLPRWLQKAFLQRHALKDETNSLNEQQQEVTRVRFQALVSGLPYKDGPHGRYFELSAYTRITSQPRQYKYYVEGTKLGEVLQNGALEKAVHILQHLGIGLTCKLFENERLVIYGKGDIADSDKLLDVLAAYGISGRGPAQDVWELTQESDGSFYERVAYSNDQALGDGAKLPGRLEYGLKTYSSEAFIEWYLKMCAFTGKSPTEPYRTSFVYALGEKADQVEQRVRTRIEGIIGYPVVFAKRRGE